VRSATRQHWQSFWEQARALSLADVYDNDGRVVREILAQGGAAGRRILEVGAGSGRDAVALASAGAQVVTVDYAVGSLALTADAARRAGARVAVVGADAFALPFADATFDVVFHQGLLEHFRAPGPLLAENARVLRPGGLLVVDVPQKWHYYTVGKQLLIACGRWFAGWETQFSPRELERLVAARGLVVERTYGDWMVPGLWYRGLRKILLTRCGLRLPMYPDPLPPLSRAAAGARRRLATRRAALYTMMTIGVVARRPRG
jgi:ubiquinone/menaquinone biosynthesis C-methylase UbiE